MSKELSPPHPLSKVPSFPELSDEKLFNAAMMGATQRAMARELELDYSLVNRFANGKLKLRGHTRRVLEYMIALNYYLESDDSP